MSRALVFRGRIAGWGTASGTRFVVGRWDVTPLGGFADVMVERPDGERVLLAPTAEVADLVGSTYTFDRVEVVPVTVEGGEVDDGPAGRSGSAWHVAAGPLEARVAVGRRTTLGRVLRVVPDRVAASRHVTAVTDPVARALLHGVRTRGSAGSGRTEHYGATDVHEIDGAVTTWGGEPLGGLAPVDPPVRFGFGSTPRRPAVTDVVTTIVLPAP
ncbi:hypothetical protein [Cellulosimicrobium marinum]|uniref:hypothetical protein n=1 Tax=Cellulosimicrobium marinum TaxID=1638992 RepID=UPI001E415077|nr:hypothetical protein [Cellulosimicrobium marinum]MCB7136056.1 hypothetical protein [Cellulosimicrobium marinum]